MADKAILNLGCGKRPIGNAVNHDKLKHSDYVNSVHDLAILPWPWENNQFDMIVARSVLEHLPQVFLVSFNEIWRIAKPKGEFILKLPRWDNQRAWDDPTHYRPAAKDLCNCLDPRTFEGKEYSYYTPFKWAIKKGFPQATGTALHWRMIKMPKNWNGK